jgi:hypothetical protein
MTSLFLGFILVAGKAEMGSANRGKQAGMSLSIL